MDRALRDSLRKRELLEAETRRKRIVSPGQDWCIIKLGRPGEVNLRTFWQCLPLTPNRRLDPRSSGNIPHFLLV